MTRRYYSSTANRTTLFAGIGSGDTVLTVNSSTGFPATKPYTLILDVDTANEEVVTVTSGSGTTFYVTRGEDGTSAVAHSAGAVVVHGFTARDLDEPNAHVNASTGVHGLSGEVVGDTDTQTLTNKSMDGDVNTFTNIPSAAIPSIASDIAAAVSAHSADTTNVHGIADTADVVLTGDSRLSDSRTPTAHAASHASAGSDPVTLAQSQITDLVTDLALKAPLAGPTFTGTVVLPSTTSVGTVSSTELGYLDGVTSALQGQIDGKAPSSGIAPSAITGTAVVDADSRLTDARTPTAHAASHTDGGSDEITVAEAQVTGLTAALAGKASTACLWFGGVASNYVSCPDSASLDIVGDLTLIVHIAPATGLVDLITKWVTSGQFAYGAYLESDGDLRFYWSENGTATKNARSTAGITIDGSPIWVAITLDVDNGAVGNDVRFFTSADGTAWTQLGTTVTTAAVTSVFAGTSDVEFGRGRLGASYSGKLYRAQIASGIGASGVPGGTTVAHYSAEIPATRYRDAYGNVFTLTGTANAFMEA